MLSANYSILNFIQKVAINHFGSVFFPFEIGLVSFPIIYHASLQNYCGLASEKPLLKT